ncbi:MAG: FliA/WhiG family RNA polymerase sigma factor [Thermodesulfobacteriota bacterium]
MRASVEQAYASAPAPPVDEAARLEERLRAHLPLVRRVARRLILHKPPHIDADELVSWGMDGLLQALQRFDPAKKVAFEAYARLRIRGAILDRLRATDFMARRLRLKAKRLERAYRTLESRLGRPASEEEVAAELGVDLAALHEMLAEVGRGGAVSVDDPGELAPLERPALEDILDADRADPLDALLSRERAELVAKAIAELPPRERRVIALYYHEGITMREVAEVLGVTESRVSQLHSQALLRLSGKLASDFTEDVQ